MNIIIIINNNNNNNITFQRTESDDGRQPERRQRNDIVGEWREERGFLASHKMCARLYYYYDCARCRPHRVWDIVCVVCILYVNVIIKKKKNEISKEKERQTRRDEPTTVIDKE
uniref:Uncharacterized protein n=1 Tax=Schizaphis graminum TaxID=13262 RepID=A0A2S2N7V8_SCHGA